MAFAIGKSAVVLVNEVDLSAYLNEMGTQSSVDTPETTTFGKSTKTRIVGLKDGTLSLKGFFDGDEGAVDEVLQEQLAATLNPVVSAAPVGLTIGNPVRLVQAVQSQYAVNTPLAGVVAVTAELAGAVDEGVEYGVSLHALTEESSTDDAAAVDNAASSANGAVAHLHCLAVSGTDPTLDVLVEDSADDMSYSTLITFTQLAAVGYERMEAAGTVERYVRASWTIGGTDSPAMTFAVAVARR